MSLCIISRPKSIQVKISHTFKHNFIVSIFYHHTLRLWHKGEKRAFLLKKGIVGQQGFFPPQTNIFLKFFFWQKKGFCSEKVEFGLKKALLPQRFNGENLSPLCIILSPKWLQVETNHSLKQNFRMSLFYYCTLAKKGL